MNLCGQLFRFERTCLGNVMCIYSETYLRKHVPK